MILGQILLFDTVKAAVPCHLTQIVVHPFLQFPSPRYLDQKLNVQQIWSFLESYQYLLDSDFSEKVG